MRPHVNCGLVENVGVTEASKKYVTPRERSHVRMSDTQSRESMEMMLPSHRNTTSKMFFESGLQRKG